MARILAIDYGSKRIGVAVTDPLQIAAYGLTTVTSEDIIPFLDHYLSEEEVECIVIGEPKRLNNEPSGPANLIVGFIRKLKKKYPGINIARMDERFTSKLAMQAMIAGGVKKKDRRDKSLIDKVSAAIILQSYLEQERK